MWHTNKKVLRTFVHHATQYVYASIKGLGWLRIKPGFADGCTNLTVLLNAAKANDRPVHIYIDANDEIATAYLL